jgi:hypothetical protein
MSPMYLIEKKTASATTCRSFRIFPTNLDRGTLSLIRPFGSISPIQRFVVAAAHKSTLVSGVAAASVVQAAMAASGEQRVAMCGADRWEGVRGKRQPAESGTGQAAATPVGLSLSLSDPVWGGWDAVTGWPRCVGEAGTQRRGGRDVAAGCCR